MLALRNTRCDQKWPLSAAAPHMTSLLELFVTNKQTSFTTQKGQ
jgi:hypothetical protein